MEKRKPLELDDLPNELKRLIVSWAAELDDAIDQGSVDWRPIKIRSNANLTDGDDGWETDEEEEDDDDDDSDSNDEFERDEVHVVDHAREMANVRSLALVTKEFRDIALPFLYERLELDVMGLRDLFFCYKDIIPRYRHHVREFSFSMTGEEPEFSCEDTWDEPPDGEVTILKKTLEEALGVDLELDHTCNNHEEPINTGTLRAKALLIARMLEQCDRVELIERDYTQREYFDDRELPEPRLDEAIDAVIETKFAHQLTDYTIDGDGNVDEQLACLTDAHMIRHLAAFTSLRRLELLEPVQSTGMLSKLADTIAAMPSLVDLSLAYQDFVNHYFATRTEWTCQLETLRFASCEALTLQDLHSLLSHHSASLKCLELDETPLRENASIPASVEHLKFDLPKLENLSIAQLSYGSWFLDKFSKCTLLRHVRIDDCPDISFDDFQAFLDEHMPTLKSVTLGGHHTFTEGQEEILEQLLVTKNVEFDVEDPSSESSEDDFDDDDDEDDEYDEYGGGSDGDWYADHYDNDDDDAESATYSDI